MAPAALVASTVSSACAAITGATESLTVISKLPVAVLLAISVEEQLTVIVPRLKVEPDTGEQLTVTDASRLSTTVAV